VLGLAGDEAVDEMTMLAWDDARAVSANVIREIVRGQLCDSPDHPALSLTGG
jgi:hypothetical protein